MLHLLIRWIASAVALWITVKVGQHLGLRFYVEPGTAGAAALLLMALALGIANAVLRPIIQLVALPLSCLTFGLFGFVVNAALFWLAGQVVPGFHVKGFIAPLFGSVVMGLVSGVLNMMVAAGRKRG